MNVRLGIEQNLAIIFWRVIVTIIFPFCFIVQYFCLTFVESTLELIYPFVRTRRIRELRIPLFQAS